MSNITVPNSLHNVVATDLPKGTALLADLEKYTMSVGKTVRNILDKVKNGGVPTDQGLSLLHLKNNAFLSYLSNLSYVALLKLSGIPLENNSAIETLVELRVLLERIRPLEDKMKYQIEKYLKTQATGTMNSDDPTNLKSSVDAMDDSSASSDENEEEQSSSKKDAKVYKAPKISQTHYPEEEEKEDKKLMRERSRALNSAMLRDVLSEHTDDPEVVYNNATLKNKALEKRKEIERYEEANFTRITLSKKDKAALRQISTSGNLASELLSFRSMDAIDGRVTSVGKGGKKRKLSSSKKGKKGLKKKKKYH